MTERLADHTTLRVGGPASRWVEAGTTDDLVAAVSAADAAGEPVLVLSGGSNVLVGDGGFAGTVAGKPVVTVLHGRRRTTYEPVVATVSSGESVAAGSVIGRLAVVASHCFPAACLHWGLREGETYLDPLSLLGGGPVRLLPLWRDRPRDAAPSTIPLRERWTRPLDAMP